MTMKQKLEDAKKNISEKADALAEKAKNIDVEGIKKSATDAKDGVSLESVKGLSNPVKIGIGAVILIVISLFLFSGGNHSVGLSDIKSEFPSDGSIAERCEAKAEAEYTFWRLMLDQNETKEDIIAAYAEVSERFTPERVKLMDDIEKGYWQLIKPAKYNVEKLYGKSKEKKGNYSHYEKMAEYCVTSNTPKG